MNGKTKFIFKVPTQFKDLVLAEIIKLRSTKSATADNNNGSFSVSVVKCLKATTSHTHFFSGTFCACKPTITV